MAERRLVARLDAGRGFTGFVSRRLYAKGVFPKQNYVVESEDGERVGTLRMRLTRANEFEFARPSERVLARPSERVLLTREGFLVPRFEAHRVGVGGARELVASLQYDFVTGAMDVTRADGTRRRLEQVGFLLPTTRLVEPGGRVVMAIEAWRLYGHEYRITLRPAEDAGWSEDELLVVAALVFHARVSLRVLFSAALSAGVLAPAETERRKRPTGR